MQGILSFEGESVRVLPGTFYRDLEKETLSRGLLLPCYTASKNLCAIGGMIGNNAGGEKTLRYGKMERYVESLQVVFSDGNTYEVKPLSRDELEQKMNQGDFEGNIYKNIFELIEANKEEIEQARPLVSKNSAGYYLWNVWDGKTFDLTKLIVGSQGTLGIVTEAKLRLVPVKEHSRLFVIFLRDLTHLSELVNEILPLGPESLESYDDQTMNLAVRFFPEMLKSMHTAFFKLMWSFLPEAAMILTGGIPKLIVLVEFTEGTLAEVEEKMLALQTKIKHFHFKTHMAHVGSDSDKRALISCGSMCEVAGPLLLLMMLLFVQNFCQNFFPKCELFLMNTNFSTLLQDMQETEISTSFL
jgi:FAD/FMN-containing dehydrogenase